MTTTTKQRETILAALQIAEDIDAGRVDSDALDAAVAERCREMFGGVAGSDDPLWPVQIDVARQVLGHGGIPAAELAQWLSAARSREDPGSATDCPSDSVASLSGPLSGPRGGADGDPEAEARSVVRQLDIVDTVDDDDLADVPDEVLAEAEAAALAVIDRYRQQREGDR